MRQVRVDVRRPAWCRGRLLRFLRQEMMIFRMKIVALEIRKAHGLERISECRISRTWWQLDIEGEVSWATQTSEIGNT